MCEKTNEQVDSIELSKMFHEIKNPLTLINSSLQLIESDHPEVKTFQFWEQTMKDIQNLRGLINDLSSFQKGNVLHKTRIDLFDFLEELIDTTTGFLMDTGCLLTIRSTIDYLDFYADETKLRQALINIIKNAAESTRTGTNIILRLSADDTHLTFVIEDHGCGISEETLSHIFEPFHTTKPYGTGLGLPIVKKIAESHHGTLSIQSQEGAGTTVTMILPLS